MEYGASHPVLRFQPSPATLLPTTLTKDGNMVRIYGLITPTVLKTLLTAEELSVYYEHVPVNLLKGEQHAATHRERHPFGMVPVLEHEGRYLWESDAISRYLANLTENTLYPRDVWQRAVVDQWMQFASNHVGRQTSMVYFQRCMTPAFGRTPDETKIAEAEELLKKHLPILETHLSRNAYLTGETLSLADIALFALTSPRKKAGLDFSIYPNLTRFCEAIGQRPSVRNVASKLAVSYLD